MKVIQIVPGVHNESAGPSLSVPCSTAGLVKNGVDAVVYTVSQIPNRKMPCTIKSYPMVKFPIAQMARSPLLLKQLKRDATNVDIIHTNSLWMFPNVYQAWAAKGTKCKTVIGPRGTVSAWARNRSKIKKFFFGHLWQYPAMRKADMFVATCPEEAEDIRKMGFSQPIAIIPNGIDVPEKIPTTKAARRRMYFLSRIHPKKNVGLLIKCWAKLEKDFPDWDLSIVGPDKNNAYADEMKELAARFKCQRIKFEGELKGASKNEFVAASECLVLPTHSENFGMVVAEALALGTPVICSTGAPWKGLIQNKCGWWIPAEEVAFENAMREAMLQPREILSKMGLSGRNWMLRDFTWQGVGAMLKMAYEWLLHGGVKPDFVIVGKDLNE